MEETIITPKSQIETVLSLIEEKKYAQLKQVWEEFHPQDIAEILVELYDRGDISKEVLTIVFRLLPKETAADVFIEMDSNTQETLIKAFSDKELEEVLDNLFLDDTIDVIEEMPSNVVRRIMRQSSPEMRIMINKILHLIFKLCLSHLSVCKIHFCLRNQLI